MKLKRLILDSFKGVTHGEYNFSDITTFCGKNGTGKTTLADAWYWLFTDKDYDLQSNPEIHPDFMEESEPSVTAVLDIDGKEVTLRKYQSDMRTKKQKEQNAPVRIANKYEVNDVPKTQKDFMRDVEDKGIDIDGFMLLTHTDVFTSQKSADCRKILFGMIEDVTDKTVADMIPECATVAEKLNDYTAEELTAMSKATAKKCKEQKDAIPNQIIGMEKAKVETNPELPTLIKALEEEIAKDTEAMNEAKRKADAASLNNQIRELRNQKTAMYNEANTERLQKYREAYAKQNDTEDDFRDAKNALERIKRSGDGINASYKEATALKARLEGELKNLKAEKFTAKTVCPTCGQKIPKEQIAEAKANWQKSHDERVKDIEDKLRAVKTQIESYKDEGKKLAKDKADAEKNVEDTQKAYYNAKADVDKYSQPITPDYGDIDDKIAGLEAEVKKCSDYIQEAYKINDSIGQKKRTLKGYTDALAAEKNNDRIDERIEEMKASLRQYSQALADAESMLYQLQLISQKKNELLSEQVNSHFTRVKFRLFVTQKNGEIKDDCTPMVLCADGEYRDMTYSANTAAIVAAKLDICSGLQKFYGQNLPIWLDGAECLDEQNRNNLKLENQLILLCVSEDDKLTVR